VEGRIAWTTFGFCRFQPWKKPEDSSGLVLKWLTVVDEIRNFCVTSKLEELKQIEEKLVFASYRQKGWG
jgi:hypothetical protein